MENFNLQGYDDEFECAICDFKCASESDMLQHYEAHRSAENTQTELNCSDADNFTKETVIKKELRVKLIRLDMTPTDIIGTKLSGNSKHPVRNNPSSDDDYSDNENLNEYINSEMSEIMLTNENKYHHDVIDNIFNEENYVNCSYAGCDMLFYIEHTQKHLQEHKTGSAKKNKSKSKNSRKYICKECDQKYVCFKSLANHIFNHFKEKAPNERVCTSCGYKSKRLSSFKIHKCNISKVEVVDSDSPEVLQHKNITVSSNEQIIKKHKTTKDLDYNPYENSNNLNNSFISDDSEQSNTSDDSDYQLRYGCKRKSINDSDRDVEEEKAHKKKKKISSYSDDKGGVGSKSKNKRHPYKDRIEKLKVACTVCDCNFNNIELLKDHYCAKLLGTLRFKIKYHCDQCKFVSNRKLLLDHFKSVHEKDNLMSSDDDREDGYVKISIRRGPNNLANDRLSSLKVVCTICNEQFNNKTLYKDHLKSIENDCDKKENIVKEKINEESGMKVYLCLKCNQTYSDKNTCIRHVALYHSTIKYVCNQCEYVSVRHKVRTHIESIHENNDSKCLKCNNTYRNKLRLREHMLRMHPSNPDRRKSALCNICGKVFGKPYKLAEHMLTHKKEKPFPCKLCQFSTVKKYNLDVHMRAHEKKGSGVYNRTQKMKEIKDEKDDIN